MSIFRAFEFAEAPESPLESLNPEAELESLPNRIRKAHLALIDMVLVSLDLIMCIQKLSTTVSLDSDQVHALGVEVNQDTIVGSGAL